MASNPEGNRPQNVARILNDPGAVEAEITQLHDLGIADLRERWQALYGAAAPKYFKRMLLLRGVAYQIQIQAFGGLSEATKRRLRHIYHAARDPASGSTLAVLAPRLKPGTRLVRSWRGQSHSVNVLADGFEWDGRRYRSLSAIAKAITGTNWNGHAFFGIKKGVLKKRAMKGRARIDV